MSERDGRDFADVREGSEAETGTRIGAVPGAGATPDISGDRKTRVSHATEPSAEMVGGAATDPAASDREPGDRMYGLDDEGGTRYGAAGTGTAAGEERLGAYPEEGRDEARRGPVDVGELAVGSVGSTEPQDANPEYASVLRSDLGGANLGEAGGGEGLGAARE